MSNPRPHESILVEEFLSFYKDKDIKVFVDATLGAGGHSLHILQEHPEIEVLIGIDQDPEALLIAQDTLKEFKDKLLFHQGNFSQLTQILKQNNIPGIDGCFFDIGVSSMQIDRASKGFSFQKDGPLDMRMDPTQELDASIICNTWPEKDLSYIFKVYGEERHHWAIAKSIVKRRKENAFTRTIDLAKLIEEMFPRRSHQKIHPATRVFQALRICVNAELEVLEKALPQAIELLNTGGRLGIITFHSLEDRIVKNLFKELSANKIHIPGAPDHLIKKDAPITLLHKKNIAPSEKEQKLNPRSRSAKLRFIEKNALPAK